MKITAITPQKQSENRVNVMVDGVYRLSLDVFQLSDLGVRVGNEYTEDELVSLEQESQFGKLYVRAVEYSLMRPHSARELRDYLYKKTMNRKVKNRKTGEVYEKEGVSESLTERVFARLVDKGYVDDEKFARFWIESRHRNKGTSIKRLQSELFQKGVERSIVDTLLNDSERNDESELHKVLQRKRHRYPDQQKLIHYLMRQGFLYDDVIQALKNDD